MRKMMKSIAAVLAVSALMAGSAFAADKLVVKDTAGTTDVFNVQDKGATTIRTTDTVVTNPILTLKDSSANTVFTYTPEGFMVLNGLSRAEIDNVVYYGDAAGSNPGMRPVFVGQRYRGTKAAPLPVMLNDKLGTFAFAGYDGTSVVSGALLEVFVDGPVTTGAVPQRLSLVTGSSPTARAERIVVKADGKVGVGTNAPTSQFQVVGLPVYADNATAVSAGLTAGAFYRTSTGQLMVVY